MTAPTLDTAIRIPDDVIFRELDGEAVILNLETGIYFGLDEVGTRMWQLLEQHGSLRTACRDLEEEFDVQRQELETDLIAFVGQLHEKGLVAYR